MSTASSRLRAKNPAVQALLREVAAQAPVPMATLLADAAARLSAQPNADAAAITAALFRLTTLAARSGDDAFDAV